ncbi:Gfo/Idh/MocA family oxidoreductase [Microbacter sp. GSS18]|nr:Gfo/Idh/MocA family oxidoreductase [Microbacter sp. GSS18]
MALRIGLVGYGVGGRMFHAPYIRASQACELVGIVARAPGTVASAATDHPEAAIHSSLPEMVNAGIDAVVISTPPATRRALVLEAVGRGVPVIADKPFAPSAAAGRKLVAAANEAGVLLNVFHNRRFDSDIVTAKAVTASGALGRITRLDLRCDQDDRATLEAGPDGGLLRDLGSHVVDQALFLRGPARAVSAHMDWVDLPAGRTDSGFVITITHADGSHSHVSSSKINHLVSRELRLHGDRGSYASDYSDVQFEALRAGRTPAEDREHWGYESAERWGTLAVDGERRAVPSLQGDYAAFYDAFAAAAIDGGEGPVPGREGVAVLEVLDAARASAMEGRVVEL